MRALLLQKGKKEVDRREGREEEGICRTNVKVLPTPLYSSNYRLCYLHKVNGVNDADTVFLDVCLSVCLCVYEVSN